MERRRARNPTPNPPVKSVQSSQSTFYTHSPSTQSSRNGQRGNTNTPTFKRKSPSYLTKAQSPNAKVPFIDFSPGGGLQNNDFLPKRSLPIPSVPCSNVKNGFKSNVFRSCFLEHLRNQTGPLYARMNTVGQNTKLMNAQCSQSGLSPHQIVIYEIAKLMATVPTENLGEHRGLLAYHSTGSGKTVSSLGIIMAFWPSEKKIVVVSTKSNTNQALASYKREAPKFFPNEVKAIATEYKQRKRAQHLSDTEAFYAALDERVKGLTFVEARNRIAAKAGEFKTIKALPLHAGEGTVMIIDEAQGLAVKSRSDRQGDAIKLGCALRKLSKQHMRKIRVFAMTATPGNSIKQWLKLLSVVRRADQAPFALDNDNGADGKGQRLCDVTSQTPGAREDATLLTKLLKGVTGPPPEAVMRYVKENLFGLVAYVDIRSDLTRHACVKEIHMNVPMDRYYYLALLKYNVVDRLRADRGPSEVAQHSFDPRMPDVFMKRMRVLGQTLPKTSWSTLPKEVQEELVRRGRILKVNAQSEGRLVSPKFIMLSQYLAKTSGKQYCYTVSGNEFTLGMALSRWFGITNVTRKAEAFNGAHYNKTSNKVVGIPKGNNMIILNDTTTKEHRERLVGIFNSPSNVRGDYIKIVIASGQLYEGLDLSGLRHVHIAEPLPTPLQEVQAIGRGPRNCSHRGLPLNQRTVTIVRWYNAPSKGGWEAMNRILGTMKGLRGKVTPVTIKEEYERIKGLSYDTIVLQRARDDPEFLLLQNWERIMQTIAVDCAVLKRYHPKITCGAPLLVSKVDIVAGAPCRSSP